MSRWIFVSILFMLMGLNGCTNMDRVAPMSWTYYLSNGTSEAQIRVALLECGYNVPGDPREFYRPDGNGFLLPRMPFNEMLLVMKCMQNAGFTNSEFGDTCNHWKDLSACKPGVVIPRRSVENRLGSPFCQLVSKAKICQPNYDPRLSEVAVPADSKPVTIAPSTDQTTKLQEQVQKISNTEMKQLLQGIGTRK